MQIQVSFDTEKEDVADLKKLCAVLQTVIFRREGRLPLESEHIKEATYSPTQFAPSSELASLTPSSHHQFQAVSPPSLEQAQPKKQESPKDEKTAGGGRVIPFEDITKMMSNIYSGKKVR